MKSKITFGRERADDILPEAMPLVVAHYKEISHYPDIELDPNIEKYRLMEDEDILRTYTARTEDGRLVGYAVFFMGHALHYQGSIQANQDVIFIDKKHRGFGMRFIDWCDQQLREEGVQLVYHHVKAAHNFGPMLERLGYELVDHLYGRRLDRGR